MARPSLALIGILIAVSAANITDLCISCIAKVELGRPDECNEDQGSPSCGVYQIKEPYWQDCYEPGRSLEDCAFDEECAKNCIRTYTARYAYLCKGQLGKKILSCEDYGRMHNGGGPSGCRGQWTLHYVELMRRKCTQQELNSIANTNATSSTTTRRSSTTTRRSSTTTRTPSTTRRIRAASRSSLLRLLRRTRN